MPLKVAILGTAPSRSGAPFDDPTWEIWAQSQPDLPRWDRWFELHDPQTLIGPTAEDWTKYLWAWLTGTLSAEGHQTLGWMPSPDGTKPVYLRGAEDQVKGGVVYPRDKIIGKFGPWFFTSTVAWEIAFAIAEGAKEIALYGIDMADSTEYEHQKPGCQHFIAMARLAGIKVSVPSGCELLSPGKMYALAGDDILTGKILARKAHFTGLMEDADKIIAQAQSDIATAQDSLARAMVQRDRMVGVIALLDDIRINWTQ